MGFLDPKKQDDHDEIVPGAPGLHLDLDERVCPDCRRTAPPWQQRCPDCGSALVAPNDVPAPRFALPADPDDDGDDEEGHGGGEPDPPGNAGPS